MNDITWIWNMAMAYTFGVLMYKWKKRFAHVGLSWAGSNTMSIVYEAPRPYTILFQKR